MPGPDFSIQYMALPPLSNSHHRRDGKNARPECAETRGQLRPDPGPGPVPHAAVRPVCAPPYGFVPC